MATRGAKTKTTKMTPKQQKQLQQQAVVQVASDDDSDDEAPEVVTKASAQEQALDQLRQEKEAKEQATAADSAKRKRKTRADAANDETDKMDKADAQQEGDDNEDAAPELPADVLSALATREEEDRTEAELEAAREQLLRKRAIATAKRTHIRDFGTVQVQTLDVLEASQSRHLTESAADFLVRKTAPQRARMNVLEGHASQFSKKQKRRA